MEGASAAHPAGEEASFPEQAAWIGVVVGAVALLVVSLAGYVQLVDQTSGLGFVTHASWWLAFLVSLGLVTLGAVATDERRVTRGAWIFFGVGVHLLADISLASWLALVG